MSRPHHGGASSTGGRVTVRFCNGAGPVPSGAAHRGGTRMIRRADTGRPSGEPPAGAPRPVALPAQLRARPDVAGALDGLLSSAPVFRAKARGYDRMQVDNYVAWAEAELLAARRENDDL